MALDKNTMFEIIKDVEGNHLNPYYDSSGLITIGVGFNIEESDNNGDNDLRDSVFIALGIAEINGNELRRKILYNSDGTVNETATTQLEIYFENLHSLITDDTYNGSDVQSELDAQSASLNTSLNTIMSQIHANPLLEDYVADFHTTFALTLREIRTIFDEGIDTYSGNVDTFLNSITGTGKLDIRDTTGMYRYQFYFLMAA